MSVAPPVHSRLAEIRRRLSTTNGREFWRSLDELADSPDFAAFVRQEFPQQALAIAPGAFQRREFLKVMAASLALAGLGGCTRQPPEEIVPYVHQPEHAVLGEPIEFATAMPLGGYAIGILAESHDGRPTKLEGNPQHPASLGATDAMVQASLLGLYDPDRSQVIMSAGAIRTWPAFRAALREALGVQNARSGSGLRILTRTVTSPTLANGLERLLLEYPGARWHQWDPLGRDAARGGSQLAFGEHVETRYRFDRARVVVSLDADIFGLGPGRVRYTRDYLSHRRPEQGARGLNRLYVIEPVPSVTGSQADHRIALRATEVEAFARALAAAVQVSPQLDAALLDVNMQKVINAIARDLQQHRGASVVVAGEHQPPIVHALAHAMNHTLGNVGSTVVHTDPVEARPVNQAESLRALIDDMESGHVEVLLILGGNPVYDAPPDLRFGERLQKVPLRLHLGPYEDETATLCHWHVPEAHYLESWADARAFDGTTTILQPLIEPLYGGKTAAQIIAACFKGPEASSHDIVRTYWSARYQEEHLGADFESFWRQALHDGVVPDSAARIRNVQPGPGFLRQTGAPPPGPDELEVVFRPGPYTYDGSFANNGWLQELPQPLTKLTWDNAALVAPATAERLGHDDGDVVELRLEGRTVRAPLWVVPGHAADSVTLHLGYGRWRAGRVGTGVGFDAYLLRQSHSPGFARGLDVAPTGARHAFATTQEHNSMEGRHLVRTATVAEYQAQPDFAQRIGHAPGPDMSMFPRHPYDGHAWGMTIDLSRCIGCHACVAACQAENNIAVVGKQQVQRGREMHWIRVDRYFGGDLDDPMIYHQPVPCMHCENAPCELVCPVNATVHSSEGLNDMVYNRCVGTRYCSNNCPYKVRRFNFFLYSNWTEDTLKMARNPDVTVRSRGVMEKCTYCVQRIERGRIQAANAGRPLRDGEIVTACQQACPADAIVFGDLNDDTSRVAALKKDPRNYGLLEDRNTRPRTTYLAAVRNPNPELESPGTGNGHHGGGHRS